MANDIISVGVSDFRRDFPEFLSSYSDGFIEGMISQASCYISNVNYGVLRDGCRFLAIELMTAHLLTIQTNINQGNTQSGAVQSTSVDKISVSLVAPPNKTQFDFWCNQSIYGIRYLALLQSKGSVPFYVGGSMQRVLR